MFILQISLISILYYLSNVYSSFGGFVISKYTLCRPLIGGFLCGIILGDLKKGIELGIAMQLAFMGTFAVGGAITMDIGAISYPVIAVAIISNLDVGAALAIATPISILAANLIQIVRGFNTICARKMRVAIEEVNYKNIIVSHYILPQLFLLVMSFTLSFVFIYFGAPALEAFVNMLPDKILNALGQFAKVLPAVGMALLLKYNINDRAMFLFFVFGFMLFSYAKMGFIPIAIIGLVVSFMYYKILEKNQFNDSKIDKDDEDIIL
ncbi:PTS mannose/fructose/sorbose/N-acetylgalactosamine transporter subunit IIC [Anaerococcus lactolyticus]|uniref:PTS mannose/fructose/sorbose/N-acetylgalactosamine transporter subunit IIC n=1 Tax=Anaerococcus lactolyticus TaxID=33032 RepID=UPI002889E4DD|nr:PTS sugar transporter subunit IIC [Anaerococcus lactolyticus]